MLSQVYVDYLGLLRSLLSGYGVRYWSLLWPSHFPGLPVKFRASLLVHCLLQLGCNLRIPELLVFPIHLPPKLILLLTTRWMWGFSILCCKPSEPLWQGSCWFTPSAHPVHFCSDPAWGWKRMGEAPGKNAIDSRSSYLTFSNFFTNNCFSICCMPLVDFKSPEMVVLGNFVHFYHCIVLYQKT